MNSKVNVIGRIGTAALFFLVLVFMTGCEVDLKDEAGETDVFIGILYREMISITGGTPDNFNHTISDFKLAGYEVTYDLWYKVHNWALSNGYTFANPGTEGNDGTVGTVPTTAKYEPVTTINWRDAIVWCNAYSEMSGYTPVYENVSGQVIKDSNNAAETQKVAWYSTNSGSTTHNGRA